MTGTKRVVGALSIAVLGLSGAAMAAPTMASASPSVVSAGCGYPPGACTVSFNRGTYAPGAQVQSHTRRHTFKPNEVVIVTVKGPHKFHKGYTHAAGVQGGFSTSFKLPKNAPKGRYTVAYTGRRDGRHLTGHINVS